MDNKAYEADMVGSPEGIRQRKDEKPMVLRPYPGMNKEDLLKFSTTPFWNRLRMISMIIFWVFWIGLFVAVIAITIAEDRCDEFPDPPWWESGSMYQVYVRSFKDSDNDGYGDLAGIQSSLSHVSSLEANTLVLNSFYESHGGNIGEFDYGYDITDHMAVNAEAGTMADFEALLADAHSRGLHIIVEFIPNHTGTNHQWFQASRQSRDSANNAFWNYYVWADGQGATPDITPPNNWRNVYGDSAWSYEPLREQWYLNNYLTTQPELNLRSTAVQNELESILRFWLDLGVDGIQVNSASLLVESTDLQDEPVIPGCGTGYECLNHVYTRNQPENVDLIAKWRRIVDEYTSVDNPRILIADVSQAAVDPIGQIASYYGYATDDGAHLVLNYRLTELSPTCDGACVAQAVDDWLYGMPSTVVKTWMSSTHDIGRNLGASQDVDHLKQIHNMLLSTLPGATYLYYGDEIGMKDGIAASDPSDIHDPAGEDFNRDPFRSPMQWNDQHNGGFLSNETTQEPWLPLNDDYTDRNVDFQTSNSSSIMRKCRELLSMKKTQGAMRFGKLHYAVKNDNVFSYIREWEGHDRLLIALNFGDTESTDNYRSSHWLVDETANVEMVSTDAMGYAVGDEVDTNSITLPPGTGIIISWAYSR